MTLTVEVHSDTWIGTVLGSVAGAAALIWFLSSHDLEPTVYAFVIALPFGVSIGFVLPSRA
jgi:uncharacterized membrane protein YccC